MLRESLFFLLILGAFTISCEDNKTSIGPILGNKIDSVTLFSIRGIGDTSKSLAEKFDYNTNNNISSAIRYSYDPFTGELLLNAYNIFDINSKEAVLIYKWIGTSDDIYDTIHYTFDANNFVRSKKITNSINSDYTYFTYTYNSSRQLNNVNYLRKETINNIANFYNSSTNYFWEKDNIKYTIEEFTDLSTSNISIRQNNYSYHNISNPLDFHGIGHKNLGLEKLGKSCRNLVSKIENEYETSYYEYDVTNQKIKIKETRLNSTFKSIFEIFYSD